MPINVNNPEADALTRKFARMAGVGITDAIVIAMKEAIERRRSAETPLHRSLTPQRRWTGTDRMRRKRAEGFAGGVTSAVRGSTSSP